jgi:hypothetical protein
MGDVSDYLTLSEAARLCPGRPHASVLWRWCRHGIKSRGGGRIRLQHIRAGHRLFITEAWLRSFLTALTEDDLSHFQPIDPPPAAKRCRGRSEKQEQLAVQRAGRELAASGI